MLYCPHGSVRCPYESMGEIRLLEMPVEIHLSIHCLSGQSVSEKPSLWLCLEICISVISVFVRWNFFLHQGAESWPSWCSDGAAAAALWTPTVALHAGSEQGASRQCTCLLATVCVLTVRQGLGRENLVQSTSAHKGMLGLRQSHTSYFWLLLSSFTEQISNLATIPFCRKVLVPFPGCPTSGQIGSVV